MVDITHFKSRLLKRREELAQMIETFEDRLDDPKPNDSEDRATASENDVYGICLSCEGPISSERLEAVLHATKCRRCMEAG